MTDTPAAPTTPERGPELDNIHGPALIAHTREQTEKVIDCLDSLAGLWRLVACPDPHAHDEARSTPAEALDVPRLARAIHADLCHNDQPPCPVDEYDARRLAQFYRDPALSPHNREADHE